MLNQNTAAEPAKQADVPHTADVIPLKGDAPYTAVRYAELGYDSHGIIPHDAGISEASSLFKKVGTPRDQRGKVPGRRNKSGKYASYNWTKDRPSDRERREADDRGDGVGLLLGKQADGTYAVAVDADTIGEADGRISAAACDEVFGREKVRVGVSHRPTFIYRFSGPVDDTPIEYDGGGKIEFLADGRQTVVEGIHPKTKRPYIWPRGRLGPFSDLPIHEPSKLATLKQTLLERLPGARIVQLDEDGAVNLTINEAAKRATVEQVNRALSFMPNNPPNFGTRRGLLSVIANVKVALADEPEAAREIVQGFAAQYVGPAGDTNDPDDIDDIFDTVGRSPSCGGFLSLRKKVRLIAGQDDPKAGEQAVASLYLEPVTEESLAAEAETQRVKSLEPRTESVWDVAERRRREDAARKATEEGATKAADGHLKSDDTKIAWARVSEWADRPIEPMEWELPGLIPSGKTTLLYGDGGIGKTLWAHQFATASAAGVLFLGMPTRQRRVLCFLCEDSEDVLVRRQADINKALGVDGRKLGDNLRIASREFMENTLANWDRSNGSMKRLPLWDRLVADALEFRAEVIIIDAIADVFAGDEINRHQVNSFIKAVLGRLAAVTGATVIALGHPSVAGKASGSGLSGSTQWSNAVRSRLYLRYPKGVDKGNIRELEGVKSNYSAKGALLKLRWSRGAFELVAASIQASSDSVTSVQPLAPSARPVANIEDACDAAVFDAVQAHPGIPLSMSKHSTHYAPRVLLMREPHILAPYGRDEIETAIQRLAARGALVETEVGRDAGRRVQRGFVAVLDMAPVGTSPSQDNSSVGVFD